MFILCGVSDSRKKLYVVKLCIKKDTSSVLLRIELLFQETRQKIDFIAQQGQDPCLNRVAKSVKHDPPGCLK
jgi:hypothetical protein